MLFLMKSLFLQDDVSHIGEGHATSRPSPSIMVYETSKLYYTFECRDCFFCRMVFNNTKCKSESKIETPSRFFIREIDFSLHTCSTAETVKGSSLSL